jgi:hypothetical protein
MVQNIDTIVFVRYKKSTYLAKNGQIQYLYDETFVSLQSVSFEKKITYHMNYE